MNTRKVTLEPKKWVKVGYYLTAPVFISLAVYVLYNFYASPETVNTHWYVKSTLIFACSFLLISYAISLPQFHRFKIEITENEIRRQAFFSKKIAYEEIQAIKVANGMIEIHGKNIFHRISIGNLYTNYEEALTLLSGYAGNYEHIMYKGSDKYLAEFQEQSA